MSVGWPRVLRPAVPIAATGPEANLIEVFHHVHHSSAAKPAMLADAKTMIGLSITPCLRAAAPRRILPGGWPQPCCDLSSSQKRPPIRNRGTCEQWIKEGKGAIKWTRLSCRSSDQGVVADEPEG